jgi:hypothetical protein
MHQQFTRRLVEQVFQHVDSAASISPREASNIVSAQHATWVGFAADSLGWPQEGPLALPTFEPVLLLQFSRSPKVFDQFGLHLRRLHLAAGQEHPLQDSILY